MLAEEAIVPDDLKSDIARLGTKGVPVDIVFEQGIEVLGLGATPEQ